jgi:hypothetical protein
MSAINDALKGIKQLLTLQLQVEGLEQGAKTQAADLKAMAADLIAVDKRVIRIETMIEMSRSAGGAPRIEG